MFGMGICSTGESEINSFVINVWRKTWDEGENHILFNKGLQRKLFESGISAQFESSEE